MNFTLLKFAKFCFLVLTIHSRYGKGSKFSVPDCKDKQVIVHLFEWSWNAVAEECEQFLGPQQFCGVQISPPMEHIRGDPWWTRYQPVSYILESRSGNRDEFRSMVSRCNAVGVMIIADLVMNHMSGDTSFGVGTAGSYFDGQTQTYPMYSWRDFHHPDCPVNDYFNPWNVRNCYLSGLNDLNGSSRYVQSVLVAYINDLLSLGVKGFRVDAAKHMWPNDLEAIQNRVGLTVDGLPPFFIHEVIFGDGEAVQPEEYVSLGKVTEFKVGRWLRCIVTEGFECLYGYGHGMLNGYDALVFVDNHDNQRGHGGSQRVVTHSDPYHYKLVSAFMLAHEYGFKRVMSSYSFRDTDQGPPPSPSKIGSHCTGGWICEHRWPEISTMVRFANAVQGTPVVNFRATSSNLSFNRGSMAFFAMGKLDNTEINTGLLSDGDYCDWIRGCSSTFSIKNSSIIFPLNFTQSLVVICDGCS